VGPATRVDVVPGKGRGVFAARLIRAGELIEKAPVLVVPHTQVDDIDRTFLDHYVYDWAVDSSQRAVALGFGSLYNHSYDPNAVYVKDFHGEALVYHALVDIEIGREILVNYNGDPTDRTPVWFDVVE
jgi:hypothetical protein